MGCAQNRGVPWYSASEYSVHSTTSPMNPSHLFWPVPCAQPPETRSSELYKFKADEEMRATKANGEIDEPNIFQIE